jgi:murein DD-endopeptidase MepM/ murein hydrolase activator NlpD
MKTAHLSILAFILFTVNGALIRPVVAEGTYQPLHSQLVQGGFLVGKAPVGADISFEGKTIPTDPHGRFVLGFDRYQPTATTFKVCLAGACQAHDLLIQPRSYVKQVIQGVPAQTVNPDKAQTARVNREAAAIKKARSTTSNLTHFAGSWAAPVAGRISGVYGSSRTYNGAERNWHKGLDIARPTGTPVVAPAGGKVVLAADTFMNGNLLVIDHGQRLFTVYAHLNKMAVRGGESVQQGQHIGDVGTTGRSTGPHLHWGLFWGQEALDPGLLLGKLYEKPEPKT